MNRRLTKAFIGALSFAAALSTAVVFNASDAQAKKASVKKVTASAPSGKNVYVAKGKKVKITTTVKVKPNKKANKKVTYKSANKKIATVSAKGVVKGVKAGKTKITITSKKNKKKKTVLKVYVKKAAVKKVKIRKIILQEETYVQDCKSRAALCKCLQESCLDKFQQKSGYCDIKRCC